MATAIEVLEHVPDPERTVSEMARVAKRWVLVSVPREPLWRGLNMARGAYIKDLGNTPGHINHWSKRTSWRCSRATARSRRSARRSRGRWCLSALCSYATAEGRAAVPLRWGSVSPASSPTRTSRLRRTRCRRTTTAASRCCGRRSSSCLGALPAGRQLLSRTIADRAARGQTGNEPLAGRRDDPAGPGRRVRRAGAGLPAHARGPAVRRQTDPVLVLVVAVLSYAARTSHAATWRAAGCSGCTAGSCSSSRSRAVCSRCRGGRDRTGANVTAMGIAAAPLLSLAVVPLGARRRIRIAAAKPQGRPPRSDGLAPPGATREPEFTLCHGAGFAVAVLLIMICEQAIYNAGPLLIKATASPAARVGARGLRVQRAAHRRAPLQLFQAVQTSILPPDDPAGDGRDRSVPAHIKVTLFAIALFAAPSRPWRARGRRSCVWRSAGTSTTRAAGS